MTTEERLDKLERELAEMKAALAGANRRDRWLLGVLVLAILVLVLLGLAAR
jgi:hypothetical protein